MDDPVGDIANAGGTEHEEDRMATTPVARLGLLWRRNPSADERANADTSRVRAIAEALADRDVAAVPVMYSEEDAAAVRDQLLTLDGVLVWVDPIAYGHDRTQLDVSLPRFRGQCVVRRPAEPPSKLRTQPASGSRCWSGGAGDGRTP